MTRMLILYSRNAHNRICSFNGRSGTRHACHSQRGKASEPGGVTSEMMRNWMGAGRTISLLWLEMVRKNDWTEHMVNGPVGLLCLGK